MMTLVFCLEEPSAKEMLKGVLPRLLPDGITVHYIIFQGKQDMEKQLVKRLRGWLLPNTKFVIMRDQDAADCHVVKNKLVTLCQAAGRGDALVRVACRELESFYLGDLQAVEAGLGIGGLAARQNTKNIVPLIGWEIRFRNLPDLPATGIKKSPDQEPSVRISTLKIIAPTALLSS